MAWTAGQGTLAPGATTRWFFSWGGDQHVQVPRANPLNPNAELISFDFSKLLENNAMKYGVSIRNVGGFATNFNLQGGGVT